LEKKRYKILVVDDDYLSQRMMGLVLSEGGYSYETAFNGSDAVDAVQKQHFDLVLMDLQMPILDGYEATRQIRAWEAGKRHVPIVALTAMMFDEDIHLCHEAGMDDCIIKPFDVAKLYQLMDAHIEKTLETQNADERESAENFSLLNIQAALPRFKNDLSTYQNFLIEFLQMLPERMEQFQVAFVAGDFESLSKNAHNLKGVAASLGAMQLSSLASQLDLYCRDGESNLIEETMHECEENISALLDNAMKVISRYTSNEGKIEQI